MRLSGEKKRHWNLKHELFSRERNKDRKGGKTPHTTGSWPVKTTTFRSSGITNYVRLFRRKDKLKNVCLFVCFLVLKVNFFQC